MNPGYLSYILMSVTFIFVVSGWKDVWLRAISHRAVVLFIALWIVFCSVYVPLGRLDVNLACLLLLAAISTVLRQSGPYVAAHVLCVGVMLGAFTFLLRETERLSPAFLIVQPDLDAALLLALGIMLFYRQPKLQIAAVSLALLVGGALMLYTHRKAPVLRLGSLRFQDDWWLTVCLTRGITVSLESAYGFGKRTLEGWMTRRGWRK